MSLRPENVRLVRIDGSELILELALTGVDDEGYEHWAVATPIDLAAGDHVEIDVMPQMCCIEFPLEGWKQAS